MLNWLKHILCLVFVLGICNANIPLHDLMHEHKFVEADHCGHSCKKHLKKYEEACCKLSHAVRHLSLLAPFQHFNFIEQEFPVNKTPYFLGNDFKLHFFTKNKAPPHIA